MDVGYGDDDPALLLTHWKYYLRSSPTRSSTPGSTRRDDEAEAVDLMVDGGFQEEAEARAKYDRARLSSTQLSTYFVGSLEMWDIEDALRRRAADRVGRSARRRGARARVVGDFGETPGFDHRPPPRGYRPRLAADLDPEPDPARVTLDAGRVTPGLTSRRVGATMPLMDRQPGGDTQWRAILAHRPDDLADAAAARFVESGITPDQVRAVLDDLGGSLCAAAGGGGDDWSAPFGGRLAVALLAAEVSALAAHLNSRASTVRALAVEALLDEYSAVTVAARLGVSRQKVYEIGRGGGRPFADLTSGSAPSDEGETDG